MPRPPRNNGGRIASLRRTMQQKKALPKASVGNYGVIGL